MRIKLEVLIDLEAFLSPEGVAAGVTPDQLQTVIQRSLLEFFRHISRPGTGFAEPFEGQIDVTVKAGG